MPSQILKSDNFFLKAAELYAESPFLFSQEQLFRFRDFFELVRENAKRLRAHNFRSGERIAVLSENSLEMVVLLFALWEIGAIAVPVNTRWPEEMVLTSMKSIDCKKVFIAGKRGISKSAQKFEYYFLQDFVNLNFSGKRRKKDGFGEISIQNSATIIFTSGSSGEPKGVLHSFANHLYSAAGSNLNLPFGKGDCWLLSLPLFHVGGLAILFRALLGGGAVWVPQKKMNILEMVEESKFTHISLVLTQLVRLLKQPGLRKKMQTVKAILLGGSAFPTPVLRTALRLKLPVFTSYGSTEMSSQVTTLSLRENPEQIMSSGKPLKYREVNIANDGEILVKGETLFCGYVRGRDLNPARTANGWFRTGDLGEIDGSGCLLVLGRKDNLFVSGGENIQPEVIERTLNEMEQVEKAVIVPVQDDEFGKRPAAFVRLKKGVDLKPAAIQKWLEGKVPRFMIPPYFFDFPSRQETDTRLKIDREELRKFAENAMKGSRKNTGIQ